MLLASYLKLMFGIYDRRFWILKIYNESLGPTLKKEKVS